MRNHAVDSDSGQNHGHSGKNSQQQHTQTTIGDRSGDEQFHRDYFWNWFIAINPPDSALYLVGQVNAALAASDDRHERPGKLLIGNIHFRIRWRVESYMLDVANDADDFQPFFIATDPDSLAQRISPGKNLAGQLLVNNYGARSVRIVLVCEVTPTQKRNSHGAKIVGADHSIISNRRVVFLGP